MKYQGIICLLLVGVVLAHEGISKVEMPNISLLDENPETKTNLIQTLAELSLNQKQSFLDLEQKLSKQLKDTLLAQQDELKQAIAKCVPSLIEPAVSKSILGQKDFDEHLNLLRKRTYTDCNEALSDSQQKRGVFVLDLKQVDLQPFGVYCLFDAGKVWTIIQRRQDGTVDFYRDWSDYKNGFGHLNGEYWLGLDRIHALTAKGQYELWLQMETYTGEKRTIQYKKFSVADKSDNYRLKVNGFKGENKEFDKLSYNNGQPFSTFDRNNAGCASQRKGAWWYDNCTTCNPNGLYKQGNDGTGIHCGHWREPMSYFHIAISEVTKVNKNEATTADGIDVSNEYTTAIYNDERTPTKGIRIDNVSNKYTTAMFPVESTQTKGVRINSVSNEYTTIFSLKVPKNGKRRPSA